MHGIRLDKTDKLEALAARLATHLKRKIDQEELLVLCINYAAKNYEGMVEFICQKSITLSKKKVQAIKALAMDFEEYSTGTIDEDIYR